MFTTDALAAALAGRYTIERLVGEGGMAKIYPARDSRQQVIAHPPKTIP